MVAEEDAVVLGTEADQRRGDTLELLGRAFTGEDVTAQRFENLDGNGLLDDANIGPGLVGPDDPLGHCFRLAGSWLAAHLLPVGDGKTELGEHLFMGDGVVVLAPLVGFGDGFRLGGAERIAVVHEILIVDHDFEQLNDRGELAGAKIAEQFMGFRFERVNGHGGTPRTNPFSSLALASNARKPVAIRSM